jgi:hypothetical protein
MTTPTKGPATQSSGNPAGFLNVGWSGTNQTAVVGPDGNLVALGGGGGGAVISAGANSQNTGTVVFSNANSLSFGLDGAGNMTASGQFGLLGLYDGANSITSGTARFSNANGVSFGFNGQTITGSVAAAAPQTGISSIAVGGTTYTSGSVQFLNSNNFTFLSTTGQGIVGSFSTSQSVQTQASGNIPRSGFTTNATAGVVLVGTNDTAGLNLGVPAWITTQTVQTQASGAIAGSGFTSAGANIGLSGTHNSAGLSLSATVAAQTNQSAIKAFGASNTGNTAGNTGVSTGVDWVLAGTNNVTISQSTAAGGPNTLWVSGPTAAAAQTGISGIVVSNTTYTSGTVSFSNANGISFGSSAGQAITASYTVPTVTNSVWSISDNATSGTVARLAFTNLNGVTLSLSTGAGGSHTIVGSVAAAGGAQTGISSLIAGQTQTVGALSFSNANGVSFGIVSGANTGTLTASVSQSVQPVAASANNGSAAFSTLSFSNVNNVSFATAAGPAIQGSFALNVSAPGGTSNALSGLTFNNANGVSFGLSTGAGVGTMTASVSGFTNSFFANAVSGGPVTSSLTNGTVFFEPFVISNNLSMYRLQMMFSNTTQSTSTVSVSASVSAGSASSGSASMGYSNTVMLFSRVSTGTNVNSSNIVSFFSNSWSYSNGLSASVSWSTNASSATASYSTSAAFGYLQNIDSAGGTTTSSFTTSFSTTFSSTSTNANSFSTSTGMTFNTAMASQVRQVMVPFATSLSPGEYWMANLVSTASATTNFGGFSNIVRINPQMIFFQPFGAGFAEIGYSATNASSGVLQGRGSYSASSQTSTTIPLSNISGLLSQAQLWFNVVAQTR